MSTEITEEQRAKATALLEHATACLLEMQALLATWSTRGVPMEIAIKTSISIVAQFILIQPDTQEALEAAHGMLDEVVSTIKSFKVTITEPTPETKS